ncbi:MAG: acetate kinase, partial [Peptococcaceae bacterium]|nr:acetate kinase [Peptococcaceae bacterium]
MKVLVINCGSSSLKYQLMDMDTENAIAKGLVERIGIPGSVLTHRPADKEKVVIEGDLPDHVAAIKVVLDAILHPEYGAVKSLDEIDAVGHRVVHGGEKVTKSVLIDENIKNIIRDCAELSPLHNPANLAGILACEKLMPKTPQVAVFDTAFHQTMPPESYMYGLPYELYEKYHIRRYGFHGTSHKYVSQRAAVVLDRNLEDLKIITCHLGNGSSISAIKGGKCIDTSMGLTPLQGLTMGTRSGDIDPTIVSYIIEKEGLTAQEANDLLNKKSGVLGLSGVSSDFRDIEQAAKAGNYRAQLALDVFVHDVKKYIG